MYIDNRIENNAIGIAKFLSVSYPIHHLPHSKTCIMNPANNECMFCLFCSFVVLTDMTACIQQQPPTKAQKHEVSTLVRTAYSSILKGFRRSEGVENSVFSYSLLNQICNPLKLTTVLLKMYPVKYESQEESSCLQTIHPDVPKTFSSFIIVSV